jgi:hypothetical protein
MPVGVIAPVDDERAQRKAAAWVPPAGASHCYGAGSSCTMSSATPSPKSPRSPAGRRRRVASWPPRARRRLRPSQAPATPTARQAGIVRAFKQAWQAKDIGALIGLLDPDATAIADGGGLVDVAELRPIQGSEQIARAVVDIAGRAPNLTIMERTVNGQPGLVLQQYGVTMAVLAFDVAGDRITRIWAVRNPEKLRPWTTG